MKFNKNNNVNTMEGTAYALNCYFFNNYMNDKEIENKVVGQFSKMFKNETFLAMYGIFSFIKSESVAEKLVSFLRGCFTEAVIEWISSLTNEKLENIVGIESLPYALEIKKKSMRPFIENATNAFYAENPNRFDELINYFA